jgi:hypothetical protein
VLGAPARVFRNVSGGGNHRILLRLVGSKDNRLGLGAQVKITTADGRTQWNQATTAAGYACSSDSRVHFGLGATARIQELEVRWPGGTRQVLHDVAVDRVLTIEERAQ